MNIRPINGTNGAMIAPALTYFNALISGELNPLLTHIALLGGSIVAEFAVAIGIILESPSEKDFREKLGMWLVLGGVAVSAICMIGLFVFDEGISRQQQDAINDARSDTAKAGVTIGELTATLEEMRNRLTRTEEAIRELQRLPVRPPTSSPAVPPPPAGAATSARRISADARNIIRSTTLPGAIISIIPFMPGEPQAFSDALGEAFSSIPGVQVAVGRGNFIMNGQTGLIVQYDHSNPTSASVFDALVKAGLNPTDGPGTPGTPITFIKVAPQ